MWMDVGFSSDRARGKGPVLPTSCSTLPSRLQYRNSQVGSRIMGKDEIHQELSSFPANLRCVEAVMVSSYNLSFISGRYLR